MTTNSFFFFNDTATTEIYTLSLHDALPICFSDEPVSFPAGISTHPAGPVTRRVGHSTFQFQYAPTVIVRSEEHTSELQSRRDLVCRLLLEKKKKNEQYIRFHAEHQL